MSLASNTTTPSSTPPTTRRRGRLIAAGIVVLVGMLSVAGALWWVGEQRRADNVAGFARAPVGCDTTLDFERTGTFVLYVETTGSIDDLAGGCDAPLVYDGPADVQLADVLRPRLTLLGPDEEPVEIDDAGDGGYDVDGFVGTAAWSVEIDTPGDHVLRIAPIGGDPAAIAVGRSVEEGVAALRAGALATALGALVLGGGLLIAGTRRVDVEPSATPPWVPDDNRWPASPPGFPVPPPTTGAVGPPQTPPSTDDAAGEPPPPPIAPPPSSSPWGPPGSAPGG